MISDMVIHFICRGNALRSIIAEAYLNSLCIPGVSVLSSGTVASAHKDDNAANFVKTLALLKKHGVEQYAKDRYADNVSQELIDKSDIIIFLNKIAYGEATNYKLPHSTYIWSVIDLGEEGRIATSMAEREKFAEDVYQEITKAVDKLVIAHQLKGNESSYVSAPSNKS